jgi:hypothetical protein
MRHRLPRLLSLPLAASLTVLGLMATPAQASTAPSRAGQRAEALVIARDALRHLRIGQHAANHAVAHGASITASSVESSNWSGYADIDETFSDVGGNWSEPSVTCSGSTVSLAAFWVGIDGYSSDSVEQDGTLIECYDGSAYQFSWWEMYPSNDIQVVGESVAAGDHITASVVRTGDSYTLKVTDSTHPANSFSTTQSCSGCANSSAEWIAEAPSGSSGIYPLSDFHTWTVTGATASTPTTTGNICSFPYEQITMTGSSGDVKAAPSGLTSCSSFTITWEHST